MHKRLDLENERNLVSFRVAPGAFVVVAMTTILLAGCTAGSSPSPSASSSESASSSDDASESPTPTPEPVAGDLTTSDIEKIQAAISDEEHNSLNPYLGNPIEVAIAATEFDENRSPSSAVSDLDYINGTTGWVWNLDEDTLTSYRAGPYAKWFPENAIVGMSDEKYVVSFTITKDQITKIFMTSSSDLLVG
jgi:hypothetical protein